MASSSRADSSASIRSEALNLTASGLSSVSGSSRSSKRIEDAKHLSRATTQATLAAKTILSAGGTEDAALQTAKAAAQATLLQPHFGTHSMTGPSGYLCRRKIKRKSEVVASMALVSATNQLYHDVPYDDPFRARSDTAIKKMSINVNEKTMTADQPSPLSPTPRVSLLPTILSAGNDAQMSNAESTSSEESEPEQHTAGMHASEKADDSIPTPKVSNTPTIHHPTSDSAFNAENESFETEQVTHVEDHNKESELPSSESTSKELATTKPLEKGSLSLDSGSRDASKGRYSEDKETDIESKENAAPKPVPSPVIIPSPQQAAASPKLDGAKSPTTPTASHIQSPANSVLANLLRKKPASKSNVLTPTGTYFTKDPELKGSPEKRHRPSSLVISTPPASPDRDVRINVSGSQSSDLDEDDTSTLGNEPVYVVTNHERHRERRSREQTHNQRYRLPLGESSSSSSVDSSLFSMDTYRTNQTFMTNHVDPCFFSMFSNMLRCGGGGTQNVEAASKTLARKSKQQQFNPSRIVLTRAQTARDDNKEFGAIVKSPHDPSINKQRTNHNRDSRHSKSILKEQRTSSKRNVISEAMKWMEQPESKYPVNEDRVERDDEQESVELVGTHDASTTESGVFESYSSQSYTEASPPDVPEQRSKDSGGGKKVRWRKALGLKPTKSKPPSRRKTLQERTMVME